MVNKGEGFETVDANESKKGKKIRMMGLDSNDLLIAEYGYISESAFQANEDRARVSTYYVVTFGTLVAALFSLQVESADLDNIHRALTIVFLTLTLFGLSTLLQLARLRQAWTECACAMNKIKDYYVDRSDEGELAEALRWREWTIPASYKPWSIAFMMAAQVALLGGVSLGACVYFMGLVTRGWEWWPAIIVGVAYLLGQVWFYRYILVKDFKDDGEKCPPVKSKPTDNHAKAE